MEGEICVNCQPPKNEILTQESRSVDQSSCQEWAWNDLEQRPPRKRPEPMNPAADTGASHITEEARTKEKTSTKLCEDPRGATEQLKKMRSGALLSPGKSEFRNEVIGTEGPPAGPHSDTRE